MAFVVSLLIVFLLTLDETPTLAPDSRYYLELARGERVPAPFCYRPLLPFVLGTDEWRWRVATVTGLVAQGVLVAGLTGDVRASVLLLALPGGARFSVRCPVLVDPWALAGAIGLAWAALHFPTAVPLWFLLLGAMRETSPVWSAVYAGGYWPLIGLAVVPVAHQWLRRPTNPSDPIWIQHPVLCLMRRRGHFLDWHTMLVPWGVLLPLALIGNWQHTTLVYLLASVPLLVTTDTARIHQWAAPALIPAALAAPMPDVVWPVLLALHIFNPYRGA